MRGRAGMLSAAAVLAPGCDGPAAVPASADEPVRRAAFRSLATRDFLLTCPAGAGRGETGYQAARYDALGRLAAGKGAGRAVALGENDWAGVARYSEREPCGPGEEAYRQALAAYAGALDRFAAAIAEHRP